MMKLLISSDIIENKIWVNNIQNLIFKGYIIIKYFNVELYRNNLELNGSSSILWYSPWLKMTDISNILVQIFDNENKEFYSTKPIIHTRFMRDTTHELDNLCSFIKNEINVKNMIEIGSYQGESTLIFNNNFPNAKIFAVDAWINNYDDRDWISNSANMIDVENNFDILTKDHKNIIKIKMLSENFSNLIADKSIDFVYIDGDHSYKGASTDIMKWKNKIKENGFIGGHDYNNINAGTILKAISENFPNKKINVFDQSWLIKL